MTGPKTHHSRFQRHRRDHVTSRLRLRGHDYSQPGTFFVTICTQDRACLLGAVEEGRAILSPPGTVVESWWYSIPRRFPDVAVDAVVVMPNHVHGVVMIGGAPDTGRDPGTPSLSAVIQWFKGVSTNDYMLGVREFGWPPFNRRLWQKGFHEHIVRTEADLSEIRAYIDGNPAMWQDDKENPDAVVR